MKIAVIGAGGQLAHDLLDALGKDRAVGFDRSQLDLCRPESLDARLGPLDIDTVINTAAYNLVDQAEVEPLVAFDTNFGGTLNLARYCAARKLRLVHFSTDYVFGLDERRNNPWGVDDPPGPVSVYGTSKLAGEYAVRTHVENHLVVRTCGLYGRKGSRGKGGNFVETMVRLMDSQKPLRIVDDQTCTPSFTVDVALTTIKLLNTTATGIVHITNSDSCSWFEFAQEIFRQSGKVVDCQPISSRDYGAKALRPKFSVLALDRIVDLGLEAPPDWRDALARYLKSR